MSSWHSSCMVRLQIRDPTPERNQDVTTLLLDTQGGYRCISHLAHASSCGVEPNRE